MPSEECYFQKVGDLAKVCLLTQKKRNVHESKRPGLAWVNQYQTLASHPVMTCFWPQLVQHPWPVISTSIFIRFAIVSISSGPPFLNSRVTLLHSNVFAGQSSTFPTIKPIKIYTSRILYTCQLSRIMHESYASGLKISNSRIKDNFSHLSHLTYFWRLGPSWKL